MKRELELASSLGIHKLMVQSDCAELVDEMQQETISLVAAPIINDCFDI